MRIIFSLLLFCSLLNNTIAQPEPVNWSFEVQQITADEYDISFVADIDQDWAVYSQHLASDEGPIPTSLTFDPALGIEFVGTPIEKGNRKEIYDPIFEMTLIKFTKKLVYTQKVKTTDNTLPVKGHLRFMTCTSKSCLPPKNVAFSINLRGE